MLLDDDSFASVDREFADFHGQIKRRVQIESSGMLRRAREEGDEFLDDGLGQRDAENFGRSKLELAPAVARAENAAGRHGHPAGNVIERVHEAGILVLTLEFIEIDIDT